MASPSRMLEEMKPDEECERWKNMWLGYMPSNAMVCDPTERVGWAESPRRCRKYSAEEEKKINDECLDESDECAKYVKCSKKYGFPREQIKAKAFSIFRYHPVVRVDSSVCSQIINLSPRSLEKILETTKYKKRLKEEAERAAAEQAEIGKAKKEEIVQKEIEHRIQALRQMKEIVKNRKKLRSQANSRRQSLLDIGQCSGSGIRMESSRNSLPSGTPVLPEKQTNFGSSSFAEFGRAARLSTTVEDELQQSAKKNQRNFKPCANNEETDEEFLKVVENLSPIAKPIDVDDEFDDETLLSFANEPYSSDASLHDIAKNINHDFDSWKTRAQGSQNDSFDDETLLALASETIPIDKKSAVDHVRSCIY